MGRKIVLYMLVVLLFASQIVLISMPIGTNTVTAANNQFAYQQVIYSKKNDIFTYDPWSNPIYVAEAIGLEDNNNRGAIAIGNWVQAPDSSSSLAPYLIGSDAFRNKNIRGVSFGANTGYIADYAFADNSRLKRVIFPGNNTNPLLQTIGEGAFSRTGVGLLDISDSVKHIHAHAFEHNDYLVKVNIGSGIETIGEGAFKYSAALTSVVIKNNPTKNTTIGNYAFEDCTSLKSIVIPASVTEISENAFNRCGPQLTIYGTSGSYAQTYANNRNITFKNINEQPTYYTVLYYESGNDAGTSPNNREAYLQNETMTIADNTGLMYKNNSVFKCWNTNSSGTGTDYYPGSSLVVTQDLALYPVWSTGSVNVQSVTISPNTIDLPANGTHSFTATVVGQNNPRQDVVWSVTGGNASIDSNGVLTCGENNSAVTLTVKATSVVDASKSGTATVNVAKSSQVISIGISGLIGGAGLPNPISTSMNRGGSQGFACNMALKQSYTLDDAAIIWSLSGNEKTTTYISNPSAAIITLRIGDDETSGTVKLTVTSVSDPTKSASVDITINQPNTITFNSNGGSAIDPKTQYFGTPVTAPSNPTRVGYTFTGWYKNEELTNAFDFDTLIVEDKTIYASWSLISSGGGGSTTPPTIQPPTVTDNSVGTQESGIETIEEINGRTEVKLVVDAQKMIDHIAEIIKDPTNNKEITLAVTNTGDITRVSISGDILKNLKDNDFKISIKEEKIEYRIDATNFAIENIAQTMNIPADSLQNIQIEIAINKLPSDQSQERIEQAKALGHEILFAPVQFEITATTTSADGSTEEIKITKFTSFVERILEMPTETDPSKIATAIVFNTDGSYSHVPTEVFEQDDKLYVGIKSLTNSIYTVIANQLTLDTVKGHWSETQVNDMATRLILVDYENFQADQTITRAEFADYIVRALGLHREGLTITNKFTDISTNKQLTSILIANDWGIIQGYPNHTFKPDATITRQEAMTMYARAMDLANIVENKADQLNTFHDNKEVSAWATAHVRRVVNAEIFTGKGNGILDPKGTLTHAESLTAIRNLLRKAELINN